MNPYNLRKVDREYHVEYVPGFRNSDGEYEPGRWAVRLILTNETVQTFDTIAYYPTAAGAHYHVSAHKRVVMPCEIPPALAELATEYMAAERASVSAEQAGLTVARRMLDARVKELAPIFWSLGISTPHFEGDAACTNCQWPKHFPWKVTTQDVDAKLADYARRHQADIQAYYDYFAHFLD